MFTGYRIGSNAVRGTLEIVNQIDVGTMGMGDEKLNLWEGEEFTGNDLRRFIEDDSLHTLLWKSMRQHHEDIPLGRFKISYETVHLDLKLLADNVGFSKASGILEQHQGTS